MQPTKCWTKFRFINTLTDLTVLDLEYWSTVGVRSATNLKQDAL